MTTTNAPPSGVQLPEGYRPYDPLILVLLRLLQIDPLGASPFAAALYGGATMNWCIGGDRLWRLGCCAEYQGFFKYRVFTLQNGALIEIPIDDVGEGRGWLGYDLDGYMCYNSWQGSNFRPASGPGKVPNVPPIPVAGAAGGFTAAPGGFVRIFAEQNGYSGDRLVNLAEKGVPRASAYVIEIAVDAEAGGYQLAVGPQIADANMQAAAMIECVTATGGQRAKESGTIIMPANSDGTLLIRAERPIFRGFVDVLGWS